MKRDAATERQVQAADPGVSTWLSANAGSGKTRVLTDRVARLLLQGVDPQQILCLTYTKAAASEMQNRLFQRLGAWAMLDDAALSNQLDTLGADGAATGDRLATARRLFAQAIETPGGLKIQTIHSFCAAILRRFPLEAGVSPQFVEMDDRAAHRLRSEIVEEIAEGPQAGVFADLVQVFTGDSLDQLLAEIVKYRALFPGSPDPDLIWKQLDLPPGYDEVDLLAEVWDGSEEDWWPEMLSAMAIGKPTDVGNAEKLRAVTPGGAELSVLESVFLTGAKAKEPFSAKIGTFPTKATQAALAPHMPDIEALMARVEQVRPRRLALIAARKTLALHGFARAFLTEYAARKHRHGWLDFDDLILRTRDLLADPGVAEWVLYRLDGGIAHILVDEAQDTSPEQWQVITALAQEFTAGQGAHTDRARTIFVVGDKKQSIYSFQGADPEGFDRMKEHFRQKLGDIAIALADLQLEYSFRSAEAILNLVDCCFPENDRRGLGQEQLHRAFRADLPGRVDLWPVIDKVAEPDPPHWSDPVDLLAPEHHSVQLAEAVSAEIETMIARGDRIADRDGMRPVRPGDFLILVQRRSDLFHEMIRACKARGLAIAGADRLKIGGELAVKDLTALLSFLATPEDSLSLAVALRSPLFGWDEGRLYDLAAARSETHLWTAFRNRVDPADPTARVLHALRDDTDYLRPFELLDRILTRHDGRRNLIARLGPEAEDGIDALLALALDYERGQVPSLIGFLSWLQTEDVEIKRQHDGNSDEIRVMTVHGAKGLEAPIVILPDTAKRDIRIRDEILRGPGDLPIWGPRADESGAPVQALRDDLRARQEDERQRLLYVALTRAEQWLIVCAAGDLGKGESWYQRIETGMDRAGAVEADFPLGRGKRLESGNWSGEIQQICEITPTALPDIPGWARTPIETPARPPASLAPSDLGGAKALFTAPGDGDEALSLIRGRHIHLLLEHLPAAPRAAWADLTPRLLARASDPADPADIPDLLVEATGVLDAPDLAAVFAPDALVEVDLTASLPELDGTRVHGAVDRLIVSDDRVQVIDFKSNLVVPTRADDVPEGLLRQMGAYAAALRQIYPGKQIETALLWTRTATLMPLPDALITAALRRAGHLDDTRPPA
ncbi:double-strand break repair helicase AddA [Actibacterium ureilyticum]|uniref:double-strand break repair helicase AddA n=1 Tax=Actibacterium ureilyticum TaxID=1590614 RepID=UPI000BAADA66|nr:double-strand break repair helicase AddA [Actibacterium ureilyticum]